MARATSMADLVTASQTNFKKPFERQKLRDVLGHLYEWHQRMLHWVAANMAGELKPFPPLPYNWKTYGAMNVEFWQKNQQTRFESAKEMALKSHDEVMNLANCISDKELFTKGVFPWVGGSTLALIL